jgi:sphinganine-1-phosphate aldolase
MSLPKDGLPAEQVLDEIRALRTADRPTHGGRLFAYVYDPGVSGLDDLATSAYALAAHVNGLDPTAFPSLLAMENALVGAAADVLGGPPGVVGSVTGGGTESLLLAVKAARDARPEVDRPRLVAPVTAHAAFAKAAHYLGVALDLVPVSPLSLTPLVADVAAAVGPDTVLVACSAPSYAHGVVDPVAELAAVAAAAGVRCHVDACFGGWTLPYLRRLGANVPPFDFAVPGVTSISVDLHKYAYAPKGTSLLLHRTPELRRAQFFASADWPGYTMLNSTTQSTKSGGPLAGAWAVVQSLGDDGYLTLTRQVLDAVDAIVAGIEASPALSLVARPDSSLVTFETDGSCDAFSVCDEMRERGWYVQPQMSYAGQGPSIHLSVSAGTLVHVADFLAALGESVAAAQRTGPVTVDPGIASYIESLDPSTLSDADFDGLLAASGLAAGDHTPGEQAGLALPSRMAEVNAMLDLASPAMREALLVAFLDRLTRPTR